MKKLLILTGFLLLLVACEPKSDVNITIDCDTYPTHKSCTTTDPNTDPNTTSDLYIGNYENLGHTSDIVYEGRDLVPDSCDYLDNIGEWQPVWCDDFEYNGLPNSSLWNYDVGGSGWGNNELQYYTNQDEDNAFVQNGLLTIRLNKESYSGNDYTSARLVTKNTGDWLYGKVQVRAKLPEGLGTWPAIWMLPTDWEYGGWPTSGEIDIMEYVGYDPNTIHGTIHTGKYNHTLGTQVGVSTTLDTAEEEFHVYEMEWEVGSITLYIDGNEYATFGYDPEDNPEVDSFMAWPFDKQFHLILNLAFGGNWGGAQGIDETIEQADFQIDYVRVYQKDYSAMDAASPSAVTNLSSLDTRSDSMFLSWDNATDDTMIEYYDIYVNDVLHDSTTVNGYYLGDLTPDTSYKIGIVARDFAQNESPVTEMTLATQPPLTIDNRVEAELYNEMSGIQTEQTSDTGGGLNVGYIDQGDYLLYVLEVTTTGDYQVDFRIASQTNGANFNFLMDNTSLFTMTTQATGGWQNWQTFTSQTIHLTTGTYTFKIVANNDGFNINYFDFKKVN